MKKKVNVNRPKISSDEINSRKDFNSVLKNTTASPAKPLFKKPWFLSSLVVATMAFVGAVFLMNKNSLNQKSSKETVQQLIDTDSLELASFYKAEESKPCIAPPLEGLNVPYTVYKINAEKGGKFDFKTGSTFTIPKNAFVDKTGKPLKGEVELRYREFHDAADFFVSGIPMTYDSAGVKYQFLSAGMMEMLAYQDGKPVDVAPEKEITVELASNYKGTEYNLYDLDTLKNNWACLGKDKVKYNKELQSGLENSDIPNNKVKVEEIPQYKTIEAKKEEAKVVKETQIAALPKTPAEPRKPNKRNKDKYTFSLDLDLTDFPEFAVYKDVQWELGAENKNVNSTVWTDLNKTVWEDGTLKEGNKKGENYFLSLKKGQKK